MATATKLDVLEEIKLDHDNVRDLWSRFQAATSREEKASIANTLIREMAVHGDAEEISVYNDYQRLGLPGTAEHNKEEHAEIKKAVYNADSASTKQDDYDEVLGKAVKAFITHAQEEENEQFPTIKAKLTPEENDKLAREFLKARRMVPTRPHPAAPQTGGVAQKAAGAFGSLHDKVVETVGGREFVELKYKHPENF
ncbi:hypothetical protein GLOTRDRAFT_56434 [Gloeophyllum trabeum ATCC 11539]|uniref:Hemerythrin-like domain-containing protein n=1 Tax=Gloeophyllum trabeum (strain ATCC 11539 / FP-39264 / Madison 617) TaxID=670483 RepID=S7QF39_GLOTA|nr:uncharacterized protein GLOTRDRAFT_56434 [Gloeophyllum trabeum ATCC 11539]EPQ57933.1 hypothetical protein GLOTRDRAFT_56434 [Gloeophyllum trabeum ATCC 11539]